ncbi:sel1 repeat family protein, partial [Methylobacterium sp. IIF4SW-B5]|nr:sel1 repeat family protein [Methylobacterium ajmalii]
SAPAGGAAPPGGAAGGEGKNPAPPASEPVPSVDALTALYKSAPTNAADAARLRDFAEKGFAVAQFLYASLVSPTNKNAGQVAPDGRLASRYLERLAQEKEFGPAAVSAAFLYDIGGADLPRDPAKAADMTVRALELKAKDILPNLENDKWGAGYWAALQQRLAARKLYRGRIVDQRNDRTLQAAGDLLGNP